MKKIFITSLEAQVYRAPIEQELQTSFGIMRNRPGTIIRVKDKDGRTGWGETWCNFPTIGAEHRAKLINENCAGIVCGKEWQSPRAVFEHLTSELHVLSIQAAEPGPIAQAIAGIDIALWDLAAKKAGKPLYKFLRSEFRLPEIDEVVALHCYASGINPKQPEKTAYRARQDGFAAFKLKVGFEDELDHRNLKAMRELLGNDCRIMIDANQRWDLAKALRMSRDLKAYNPFWLEEPIAADRSAEEWRKLGNYSPIDLAAGENLRGQEFGDVSTDTYLKFVQPDIAKWGGFSGCFPTARKILAEDKVYCPHYLGGGVGLVASAHLLAAVGGTGMLEVDCNPNCLRELFAVPYPGLVNGQFRVPQAPGLGIEPDLEALKPYRTK